MIATDRAMLYRMATGTGFRASELRSLTPGSFDLDANPPTITVQAGYSKHRRNDVQPIRRDLAEALRLFLFQKKPGEPVFNVPNRTADMLTADLRRARALWIRETAEQTERRRRRDADFLRRIDSAGRVVDFHTLRYTYISNVVNAGRRGKSPRSLPVIQRRC